MVQGVEFQFEVMGRPAFSYLKILLRKGQQLKAERGSMIFADANITIDVQKADKGFFKSLARTFAGETFLMNRFSAPNGDGYVGIAPAFAGDIYHLPIQVGEGYVVFSGGHLASSPSLVQETKFQGFKRGAFSGENAFMIFVSAQSQPGDLFVASNGSLLEIELGPGQPFRIDNGHLVALSHTIQYDIKRSGGLKTTLFSGEGLLVECIGPGKIIAQSRNPQEFANWIYTLLPKKSND